MSRTSTPAGRLARRGFGDPRAAAVTIERWLNLLHGDEERCAVLVDEILDSADPDLAMSGFVRLEDHWNPLVASVVHDEPWLRRVARVMGASVALNQHLGVHPRHLDVLQSEPRAQSFHQLRTSLVTAVGADPTATHPVAHGHADELRLAYRAELVRIAARDLTSNDPRAIVDSIAAELADLADAVVEAALALARAEVPGWERVRLGIVALGKCGARELNYISDVDVLYVVEPVLDEDGTPLASTADVVAIGTKLVTAITRICSAHSAVGTIWPLDAALRPEGKAGPLVRTLASHQAYYERWAKNWEFQAMLKARPMAGDRELANDFVAMIWPMVWSVGDNSHFLSEVQTMRRRVISLIPARDATVNIKLGAGGLRDTEFSVQLLQLVHGRADHRLRLRGTWDALEALIRCGYVNRQDGADLADAYRFQRVLEHRVQLANLRRTHLVPSDELQQRRIARSIGLSNADELIDQWNRSRRLVQRLHQRLFYSPLLEAVARIPSEAVRLTSDAAQTRLRALGFADAEAALRHMETLSSGMTRQAEIQRQLLPAMLGWFAAGPNPDLGLLAFRQVSEDLGATAWYLRALRDEGAMAENFARILASSRYAVDLMLRAPQTVEMLAHPDHVAPQSYERIVREMDITAQRHDRAESAVEAIRAVRRRELLRLAMADILAELDVHSLGAALSDVMTATIDAALNVAARDVPNAPPLAVVALGRWGGQELSYSSDADAMIVVADSDDHETISRATRVVTRLRKLLAAPGPDPAVDIDLDLRPEGKGGPMVRSQSSYVAYYQRWSSTWEAQAMLRARPGAGDLNVMNGLCAQIDAIRYPEGGLTSRHITDIRTLKARMEAERLPRGIEPKRHVKLGPGGLSDVEWTVQFLQLCHGHEEPSLRTTNTMAALDAEKALGLVSDADAAALRAAWEFATRIRNASMLMRGRPSDAIPSDVRELGPLSELLGYDRGQSSLFVEDYARTARQARRVMNRLFWGER